MSAEINISTNQSLNMTQVFGVIQYKATGDWLNIATFINPFVYKSKNY